MVRRALAAHAAALGAIILATGCVLEVNVAANGTWLCRSDDDCIDGWRCDLASERCTQEPGSAGTGGNAGTSGTGGSAGTAGHGGTGGDAGAGGASGTGGLGGSGGSSGSGGLGGFGGVGGASGSAGTGGVVAVSPTVEFTFDAPAARGLAPGELGPGVADPAVKAVWRLEDTGTNVKDAMANVTLGMSPPITFDSGSFAPFTPIGRLALSGTDQVGGDVDLSDAGGTAQVSAASGAVILTASSPGGGPGDFNTAGILWLSVPLPFLTGDFDLAIDFTLPNGTPSVATSTQMHVGFGVNWTGGPVGSTYVRLESSPEGVGIRGLMESGGVSTEGTLLPTTASSGRLRVARTGSTHTLFADVGAGWVEVFTGTGITAPANQAVAAVHATRDEAITVTAQVDNFTSLRSPTPMPVGKLGRALRFDGTDDQLQGAGATLVLADALTLEAWVRAPSGTAPSAAPLLAGAAGATANTHALVLEADGSLSGWVDCDGGDTRAGELNTGAVRINDDQWHHVAMTFDDSAARLFIDGANVATNGASCGGLDDITFVWVGAHPDVGVLDGAVDELAIFDVALSEQQLQDHYARGFARDVSGAHAGILHGALSTPGTRGEALQLLPGAHVEVPSHAQLEPGSGDFSVTLWLTTSHAAGLTTVLDKLVPGVGGYRVDLDGPKVQVTMATAAQTTTVTNAASVNDGDAHHVAVTKWSGQICVYVDAGPPACEPHSLGAVTNAAPLVVGGGSFAGTIDALRFFDVTLSAGEVGRDAVP